MKALLAITATITLLIACGADPDRGLESGNDSSSSQKIASSSSSEKTTSSSSGQQTKSYTVTLDNGAYCNVMIRHSKYSSSNYHEFTLQCPDGTKIGCMRVYDDSKFILGTKSSYVGTSSYGLIAADGYGNGEINCSQFDSISSVSLHETSCN